MSLKEPCPIESISTVAELDALIAESETKLVIIDCYQDWCGPTVAIVPFFDKLWQTTKLAESRFMVRTICIVPALHDKLQEMTGTDISVATRGSNPLFIMCRNKRSLGGINGLNMTTISSQIETYLPKLPKKE